MDKDKEIELLKAEKKKLQEAVGAWKRKAKDRNPNLSFVTQGHAERGGLYYHYIVYAIEQIPADLEMKFVLEEAKQIVKELDGFEYSAVRYSSHQEAWLLEVQKPMDVYMGG
ncbi:hypothetical protein FH966_16905 [Lentibacillus cibarius]|uniref:Uncharacterized protein n=1 Tax=Lentibacillus cibarius TaxID=2583219 RepID=A0A549Y8U4_9BACI|nr:hypothetical protein [Lentibacillus cibarius]TRM08324.1 hypothetical protein FH966_16905 [Lentibacillus cibarius]